uniref:Uncharacterized protein n=1 Tax=Panagrolaimus sp. ES5 TaxID=591445 RepID=A0AC34FHQ7_9BILA
MYTVTYRQRFVILFFALTIPSIVFVTPIVLAKVDIEQTLNYMIQRDSSLAFLKDFKDQLVIYHNPENNDFWIKFMASLIGIAMVLIVIGSIVVLTLLTYYTYFYKCKMSAERFKMSIMLLKVMILQVFFAIFLLALPMSCAILFVMSDSKYSTIAVLFGGMVASTHCLTEFICIAYTVKPYREAFYAYFSNITNLFSRRNEFEAQMRPISYSISSQASLF